MPSPLSVIRQTGRLEASNFSTTGGSVPGGKRRRLAIARLEMVVTAESGFVPGWKIDLDQAHARAASATRCGRCRCPA